MRNVQTAFLRLCGGCNRQFAVNGSGSQNDSFRCSACTKNQPEFNPQPNDVVIHISQPRRRLVVISMTGNQVITQILGQPGQRSAYDLADLRPA